MSNQIARKLSETIGIISNRLKSQLEEALAAPKWGRVLIIRKIIIRNT